MGTTVVNGKRIVTDSEGNPRLNKFGNPIQYGGTYSRDQYGNYRKISDAPLEGSKHDTGGRLTKENLAERTGGTRIIVDPKGTTELIRDADPTKSIRQQLESGRGIFTATSGKKVLVQPISDQEFLKNIESIKPGDQLTPLQFTAYNLKKQGRTIQDITSEGDIIYTKGGKIGFVTAGGATAEKAIPKSGIESLDYSSRTQIGFDTAGSGILDSGAGITNLQALDDWARDKSRMKLKAKIKSDQDAAIKSLQDQGFMTTVDKRGNVLGSKTVTLEQAEDRAADYVARRYFNYDAPTKEPIWTREGGGPRKGNEFMSAFGETLRARGSQLMGDDYKEPGPISKGQEDRIFFSRDVARSGAKFRKDIGLDKGMANIEKFAGQITSPRLWSTKNIDKIKSRILTGEIFDINKMGKDYAKAVKESGKTAISVFTTKPPEKEERSWLNRFARSGTETALKGAFYTAQAATLIPEVATKAAVNIEGIFSPATSEKATQESFRAYIFGTGRAVTETVTTPEGLGMLTSAGFTGALGKTAPPPKPVGLLMAKAKGAVRGFKIKFKETIPFKQKTQLSFTQIVGRQSSFKRLPVKVKGRLEFVSYFDTTMAPPGQLKIRYPVMMMPSKTTGGMAPKVSIGKGKITQGKRTSDIVTKTVGRQTTGMITGGSKYDIWFSRRRGGDISYRILAKERPPISVKGGDAIIGSPLVAKGKMKPITENIPLMRSWATKSKATKELGLFVKIPGGGYARPIRIMERSGFYKVIGSSIIRVGQRGGFRNLRDIKKQFTGRAETTFKQIDVATPKKRFVKVGGDRRTLELTYPNIEYAINPIYKDVYRIQYFDYQSGKPTPVTVVTQPPWLETNRATGMTGGSLYMYEQSRIKPGKFAYNILAKLAKDKRATAHAFNWKTSVTTTPVTVQVATPKVKLARPSTMPVLTGKEAYGLILQRSAMEQRIGGYTIIPPKLETLPKSITKTFNFPISRSRSKSDTKIDLKIDIPIKSMSRVTPFIVSKTETLTVSKTKTEPKLDIWTKQDVKTDTFVPIDSPFRSYRRPRPFVPTPPPPPPPPTFIFPEMIGPSKRRKGKTKKLKFTGFYNPSISASGTRRSDVITGKVPSILTGLEARPVPISRLL